jgi:hypothetical protein
MTKIHSNLQKLLIRKKEESKSNEGLISEVEDYYNIIMNKKMINQIHQSPKIREQLLTAEEKESMKMCLMSSQMSLEAVK